MLDHVGFEVADLARSAAFYDALFHPLGGRRIFDSPDAIGYGINDARLWIVARGRRPAPGFGHVAITASGRPAVDAAEWWLAGSDAFGFNSLSFAIADFISSLLNG